MSKICTVCNTDANLACLGCGFDAETVENKKGRRSAMIQGKYSEVKTLHLAFGYAEGEESAETQLNKNLAEGWELLSLVTDVKYALQFRCAVTEQWAIIGRPRSRRKK